MRDIVKYAVLDVSGGNSVLLLKYAGVFGQGHYEWKYDCGYVMIMQMVQELKHTRIECINAKIDERGRVVGKPLSFSRFDTTVKDKQSGAKKQGPKPLVALTKLVGNKDIILGYKLASSSGKIKNVRLNDMLAEAAKWNAAGFNYVQNMIYVPATKDKKAYFKEMDESIPVEKVFADMRKAAPAVKPTTTEPASKIAERVNSSDGKSKLKQNKKEFTKEQVLILYNAEKQGIDVSMLKHPDFKPDCMKLYISDIKNGQDISAYLNPEYSFGQLSILSEAYEEGLNITPMLDPKISTMEMAELRERIERNIFREYMVDIKKQ